MPDFKTNIFFDHPKGGWSETYYLPGTDQGSAEGNSSELARRRSATVVAPAEVTYVRVSEVDSPRRSVLYRPGNLTQYTPAPGDNCDEPWQAALFRAYGVDNAFNRPLYIRGIPDSFYRGSDPNLLATNWGTLCSTSWMAFLTSGIWAVRARPKPDGSNEVFISDMVNIAGRHEIQVAANVPGLSPGDYVTFYKVKGLPRPLGMRRVTFVAGGGTPFRVRGLLPADFFFEPGAFVVSRDAWEYQIINEVDFLRTTHRDTGRPFDQSRGRRRAIPF